MCHVRPWVADATRGAFALVGMGAVFGAMIRAPITSVLIIIEMTSGYGLILPLMIANISAYIIARHWRQKPIDDALLTQDGIELHGNATLDVLEDMPLESLTDGRTFLSFGSNDRPSQMLAERERAQPVFTVVDANGALCGIVMPEEVRILLLDDSLEHVVNAGDIMRPPVFVAETDHLARAVELMKSSGRRRCPS